MLDIETALDILRAEEVWEAPDWLPRPPKHDKVGAQGRFVNQCGRCLEYRQSHRVDLTRGQRVWLCDPCSGPNPPVVVFEKPKTWQQLTSERKKLSMAAERERRREERERKKGEHPVPRVRRSRRAKGNPENDVSQGPEGAAVRV